MYIEPGDNSLNRTRNRVSMFTTMGGAVGTSWQTWQPNPDETMAYIICVGGGGSGAGGFTGSAGAIRCGGGGGGAAGQTRCLIPLMFLPKILYISPGAGGASVAPSSNGTAGTLSYVSVAPNTTAANIVVQSGAARASNTVATAGGTGGSGGNGGNGGVGQGYGQAATNAPALDTPGGPVTAPALSTPGGPTSGGGGGATAGSVGGNGGIGANGVGFGSTGGNGTQGGSGTNGSVGVTPVGTGGAAGYYLYFSRNVTWIPQGTVAGRIEN